nr:zinc finger, CCHC-type [Tanacetum cinerariifolium]
MTRPNFIDWYQKLRIVLSIEDKLYYLEQPIPPAPVAPEASRTGASSDYERFSLLQEKRRANYNMHSMGKTVNELHATLKLHEQTLPKSNAPALHAIRAGKVQKGNKYKKWQSQTTARGQNHGKRKHKQAYAPKPKIPPPPKRENPAKDLIFHECGEGLRASRKQKLGALSLYMGNGQREAVKAIGAFYLCLPSR